MAFALPIISALSALAGIGGTVAGISAQKSAAKRAKGQTEQATRIRAQELKRIEEPKKGLVAQAKALPEKAAETAAIAAGKKKRRRTTLATGPRGLLTEPTVTKPSLLGA